MRVCDFTLRPRQNGRHFPDDIFKCIFLNENVYILINIWLEFVPKGPIKNIAALVQILAWCRPGDKPLSDAMMVSLPTHLCDTRPQWAIEGNTYKYADGDLFSSGILAYFQGSLTIQTNINTNSQSNISHYFHSTLHICNFIKALLWYLSPNNIRLYIFTYKCCNVGLIHFLKLLQQLHTLSIFLRKVHDLTRDFYIQYRNLCLNPGGCCSIFQNQGTPSCLGAASSGLVWPHLAWPCHALSCLA